MRLNDPLVTCFPFEGRNYSIDLAFDNVLDVFDVQNNTDLRDYEKFDICLALLLGNEYKSDNIIDLWEYVYKQFIHFEEKLSIEYDLNGNPMPVKEKENKKTIDLIQDAEYIFASFQQAYNIDLHQEQGKLHWHVFKSLLNGLPGDTVMQRIIQIRQWKPSKGDPAEYRQAMREMQKIHALEGEEVDD